MELTKVDIDRGLAQLLPHFPEAGHNTATLRALSADWLDLLGGEDVSQAEFVAAIRQVKLKCKFFPKVADMMEAVRHMREHPASSDAVQLTDGSEAQLTQGEIDRNVRRLKILADQIAGKITMNRA